MSAIPSCAESNTIDIYIKEESVEYSSDTISSDADYTSHRDNIFECSDAHIKHELTFQPPQDHSPMSVSASLRSMHSKLDRVLGNQQVIFEKIAQMQSSIDDLSKQSSKQTKNLSVKPAQMQSSLYHLSKQLYKQTKNMSVKPAQMQSSIYDFSNQIYRQMKNLAVKPAQMQSRIDDLLKQSNKQTEDLAVNSSPSLDFNMFTPAKTVADLDVLEAALYDHEYFLKVISGLQYVCGSSGQANGLDCCYKLVDYFFDRSLFTELTLNVKNESEGSKKVPLTNYWTILKCFLLIIQKADKKYKLIKLMDFFKSVVTGDGQDRTGQGMEPKISTTTKRRQCQQDKDKSTSKKRKI